MGSDTEYEYVEEERWPEDEALEDIRKEIDDLVDEYDEQLRDSGDI